MRQWGALLLFLLVSCVKTPPAVVRAPVPDDLSVLRLAGEWSIPPLGRFPPVIGLRFGGISGLAALEGGTELLGISDDRDGSRMYRFGVSGEGTSFRVVPIDSIPLQWAPSGPPAADPEAIAILRSGNVVVASEGIGNVEPRLPPALIEYGQQGQFVRQLEVRDRFSPNPTGPPSRGVRANMGFESLTIAPGGRRLYTATETALVQDGEPASFDTGAQARLLEYTERDGLFFPGREYVYPVDPVQRPPFEPAEPVNGLVELLAVSDRELLALERSYVQAAGDPDRGANRIRVYRVSLDGATDVSALDSLAGASGIVPVTKTLILDVSELGGLSAGLAAGLDNFEGMAFGPRLADGRESLILVSDDNFSRRQRTWFLLLAIGEARECGR